MPWSPKTIIDISFPLDPKTYKNNLPQSLLDQFPGKAIGFEIEPLIERHSPLSTGQVARGVKMRLHSGSHVDAPEHWIEGGKQIQDLPLHLFVGDAVIADCSDKANDRAITEHDLEERVGERLRPGGRLLVRTDWNDRFFDMDVGLWKKKSPYLTPGALDWCIARAPVLVGIDFYHGSVAPGADHSEMFESKLVRGGILTLTNLFNLKAITKDRVTLLALPLALHGAEASPVRAVVIED
jgi:arylformamidase